MGLVRGSFATPTCSFMDHVSFSAGIDMVRISCIACCRSEFRPGVFWGRFAGAGHFGEDISMNVLWPDRFLMLNTPRTCADILFFIHWGTP